MKKIVDDGASYGWNAKEGMSKNFFTIVCKELGNGRKPKGVQSKVKRCLLTKSKAAPGYSEFSEIKALIVSTKQTAAQTSYVVVHM